MLVLNRKLGERILIGRDIVVTVLEIRGSAVKLGFQCPLDVSVHREEVQRRIREEQPVAPPIDLTLESPFHAEFA